MKFAIYKIRVHHRRTNEQRRRNKFDHFKVAVLLYTAYALSPGTFIRKFILLSTMGGGGGRGGGETTCAACDYLGMKFRFFFFFRIVFFFFFECTRDFSPNKTSGTEMANGFLIFGELSPWSTVIPFINPIVNSFLEKKKKIYILSPNIFIPSTRILDIAPGIVLLIFLLNF